MAFEITIAAVKLRDQPEPQAANPAGVVGVGDLLERVSDAGNGWWKVRVLADGREGFIRAELLRESDPPAAPVEKIDVDTFYRQVTVAARSFDTNRDYLWAVAVSESGVRNVPPKGGAVGPFQFMPATWKGMVARYGADTHVTEADITDPGAQAIFAAIATRDAQDVLLKVIGRLPTAAELYMAHFLGHPAASAVLSAGRDQPIVVPLRIFYRATTVGEGFVDKIVAANEPLMVTGGRQLTTTEVLKKLGGRLKKGLEQAAELAARLGPPISEPPGAPAAAGAGEPPWLVLARKELAKNIREFASTVNPEIEKFFTATSFPANLVNARTAWCAAFVSWCMENCGNEAVRKASKHNAGVLGWMNWGFSTGRPVIGAVALVGPVITTTEGHIAFVTGEDENFVTLLGGNQGDALNEAKFRKDSIVAYRWLDFA